MNEHIERMIQDAEEASFPRWMFRALVLLVLSLWAMNLVGCASGNYRAAQRDVAGARSDVATVRKHADAATTDAKDLGSTTANLRRLLQWQ